MYKITVEQHDGSENVYERKTIAEVRVLVHFIQGGCSAEAITVDHGQWTVARFVRRLGKPWIGPSKITAY